MLNSFSDKPDSKIVLDIHESKFLGSLQKLSINRFAAIERSTSKRFPFNASMYKVDR